MNRYNYQAKDIWNVDETGVSTVQKTQRVVAFLAKYFAITVNINVCCCLYLFYFKVYFKTDIEAKCYPYPNFEQPIHQKAMQVVQFQTSESQSVI